MAVHLARAVIAAKHAYWFALREFEKASIAPGHNEWSDQTSDAVRDQVDEIAAAVDTAEQVDAQELQQLVEVASR